MTMICQHERADLDYFVRELVGPKLNYLYNIFVGDELTEVTSKVRVLRHL